MRQPFCFVVLNDHVAVSAKTVIYVAYHGGAVEARDVIKETPKQYLVEARDVGCRPERLSKESVYYRLFATLSEAQAWALEQMQRRARVLENDLSRLRDRIAALEEQAP